MKSALAILAALSLTGCAAITPPATTQVALTKALLVAENLYEAADSLYLANDAGMSPADKAKAKSALLSILSCPVSVGVTVDPATCTGYLASARAAVKALDSVTLAQQISAITSLSSEVTALAKPGT